MIRYILIIRTRGKSSIRWNWFLKSKELKMTVNQIGFGEKVTGFLKKLVDGLNEFIENLCDDHHTKIVPFAVVNSDWNGMNGNLHFIVLRPCAYYSGTDVPYALHVHPYVNFVYVDHDPAKIRDLLSEFEGKFREEFNDGLFGYKLDIEKVPDHDFYKIQFNYFDLEFGNRYYWAR